MLNLSTRRFDRGLLGAAAALALLLAAGGDARAQDTAVDATASITAPTTAETAVVPVSVPAAAETVIFEDDFTFADAGWSLYDAAIEGGSLLHRPKPDQWSNAFYYGSLLRDADVRIKARIVETPDQKSTATSLAFWHADGKNYYSFTLWHDTGFVRVTRFQDGNSIAVVEKTIEAFAVPADGWVEMRVVANKNIAALFVDGREIAKFKGRAPEQGWKIGTFASSPKSGAATVAFRDLRVFAN